MTKSMAKRIAAVKAMNPVNAGLLHAAHELERADAAERNAWAALQRALIEFHRCEHAQDGVSAAWDAHGMHSESP